MIHSVAYQWSLEIDKLLALPLDQGAGTVLDLAVRYAVDLDNCPTAIKAAWTSGQRVFYNVEKWERERILYIWTMVEGP